jgi:hypothetical protein
MKNPRNPIMGCLSPMQVSKRQQTDMYKYINDLQEKVDIYLVE